MLGSDHVIMRNERGVALIEFALLLPLLAVVTMGTIDFGRAYQISNQVRNAAREGAAYGALHPGQQYPGTGTTPCAGSENIAWHARKEAGAASNAYTVSVSPLASNSGCNPASPPVAAGGNLTVTVSTPFTVLTPFVGSIVGNKTIRSSVTVRVQ